MASGAGPLVSVIVPCHAYGHFVTEALASLEGQIERSWEAIVVDDGSTDVTAKVVEGLSRRDPRIRYVRRARGGPGAARNWGLRLARGRYVQFLDADDLLEEAKLARHTTLLECHPEIAIVYGAARYFDSDRPGSLRYGRERDQPWMPCVSGTDDVLVALLEGNIMAIHAALCRREVILEQGGFDPTLPAMEDWDLWLRCAIAGARFLYTDEPSTFSLVRVHSGSLSHQAEAMARGTARLQEKVDAIMPSSRRLQRAREIVVRSWQVRVEQAAREVAEAVPERGQLILVDEDCILAGRDAWPRVLPMMEREGRYWGRPADDTAAIQELSRLRALGAIRIAFAFNAFWWLDHYDGLRDEVLLHAWPVHASPVLKVYEFTI
jgi:GT2 family glycosyltransferase